MYYKSLAIKDRRGIIVIVKTISFSAALSKNPPTYLKH